MIFMTMEPPTIPTYGSKMEKIECVASVIRKDSMNFLDMTGTRSSEQTPCTAGRLLQVFAAFLGKYSVAANMHTLYCLLYIFHFSSRVGRYVEPNHIRSSISNCTIIKFRFNNRNSTSFSVLLLIYHKCLIGKDLAVSILLHKITDST